MVQMIQLTRGQEETLHRLVTALEQIAEHTRLIAANTDKMVKNNHTLPKETLGVRQMSDLIATSSNNEVIP